MAYELLKGGSTFVFQYMVIELGGRGQCSQQCLAGRKGYMAIFNEESQTQEKQLITMAKLQVTLLSKRNEKQAASRWMRKVLEGFQW